MEQTIGKRIAVCRKRLKLTQDQLAEQLGVTAQAVSKWENDQSCPDITMLPKLAQIFGITTDELLGIETVHCAQVVSEDDPESGGTQRSGGKWDFQWSSSRRQGLSFAILVLLVGILTLLSKLLSWDVGFWSILWPSALLVFGLDGLFSRFSFFRLGCSLLGAWFLISNLHIWELDIGSELIFPIIIILCGVSLLVDALRKPRKPRFRITHNDGAVYDQDGTAKTKSHYSSDGEHFECSLSFGEATRTVSLSRLSSGEISCCFGELTVDLSTCGEIADNCRLDASCSFGELTFLVPRQYRVDSDCGTAFAAFTVEGNPDPEPAGVIRMDANASFGQIEVRYI